MKINLEASRAAFRKGTPEGLEALASPLLWWFCQALGELKVDPKLRPIKASEALRRAWERHESFDPLGEADRWSIAREIATETNLTWGGAPRDVP